MLLKEHRFKFVTGVDTHLFTIEEMVSGLAIWPQRFRLKLPASNCFGAQTFYGSSCDEVAEKASGFLAPHSVHPASDQSTRHHGSSPRLLD
jgi:hypothetical protein